jgi:hypothetical protein
MPNRARGYPIRRTGVLAIAWDYRILRAPTRGRHALPARDARTVAPRAGHPVELNINQSGWTTFRLCDSTA